MIADDACGEAHAQKHNCGNREGKEGLAGTVPEGFELLEQAKGVNGSKGADSTSTRLRIDTMGKTKAPAGRICPGP